MKKDKNKLKISIIIPTLNNAKILPGFFRLLQKQVYPKNLIEIIGIDGGSKDKTTEIMKQNGGIVLENPGVYADIGVSIGMKKAKGDLLMILAVDNFLNDKYSLEKMSKTFSDKSIFAAFPKHESDSTDNLLTRYVNTFTDPFNHFVYGYAANARTFSKVYKTIEHNDIYDLYNFHSSKDKPLIAFAQGFTLRSGFFKKKKDEFDDLMPVIQILSERKNIAFVHSVSLYHHTIRDVSHFIAKQKWATLNFLSKKGYGLYSRKKYLSKSQTNRITFWPIYVLTILPPIAFALYMTAKDRERMWLLHPVMCYISLYASFLSFMEFTTSKIGLNGSKKT